MTVWDGLIGQEHAVAEFRAAAEGARLRLEQKSGLELNATQENLLRAMTHAWLVTGPPGSGRSVIARRFAAALQCESEVEAGCGNCRGCAQTLAGEHPDVVILSTDKVVISIEDVRQMVVRAQTAPSNGRWRVMIVEDADRMTPNTTNTLLKAIEEPPERTVWVLCTPSPEDVLPTIRSRSRGVSLRVPPAPVVAKHLVAEGLTTAYEDALEAALAAQSHIGRARGLLQEDAGKRREIRDRLRKIVSVEDAGAAVTQAEQLQAAAEKVVKEFNDEVKPREIAALKRALGIGQGSKVSASQRSQLKEKDAEHERRAKRIEFDFLDLTLLDLLSVYRDVLVMQLGGEVQLLNSDLEDVISFLAQSTNPEITVTRMDAIAQARRRIGSNNVKPLLALEALFIAFIPSFRKNEVFV